ncbi:MAG TPA: glycoside hydrolase family 3 C-terminal domain-containing protein [Candidatus Acidoferrales bacterium]|nr:glycoside hydrolase family 3 C-terminal domain-containing protein [Candidatus Acidoferrales bacterium]
MNDIFSNPNATRIPSMKLAALAVALLVGSISQALANDESCRSCSVPVEVSGQFHHFTVNNDFAIQGAFGDAQAFREEIVGNNFSVTVPHLPAGKYTVIIGEAEIYFTEPHKRVFDIIAGDRLLVTNLDIFTASGGAGRVVYLTNELEHVADSLRGPLTLTFQGRIENAKFDTLEVLDSSGATVVAAKAADLADALTAAASQVPTIPGPEIWKDPHQPLESRVRDLISRLSLVEKVNQIRNDTPAIPRLGIPAYDFWSEGLHGVARNGIATVFPQAIGMAATWDLPLIHHEGDVISTEGRAKYNEYARTHGGNSANCTGLTFWSPNINIFRDPRWGRGQETYGEDTILTGQIGVAFIRGLQGDDPGYVKAMACAKHFAVHSGPEPARHTIDVTPPERDFYETYLPHFEMAVREGHVDGFMGAYNSVYGRPACASPQLLTDILRRQWGFTGYVVSDCGAINDIYANHHFVSTPEEAAAAAVKAGCDICCGGDFNALLKAVQKELITPPEIDQALAYALRARFRLGLFDPPELVPFSKISMAQNDTPEHEALALKAARESIVLLKNDGVLPLDRAKIKTVAVIGANADSVPLLLGNYNGTPARPVTILDGIKSVAGANISITYTPGCPLAVRRDGSDQPSPKSLTDAVAAASASDVVVYVGGISPDLEGEEFGGTSPYDGFKGGDRTRIELPSVQEDLLKALQATGKPVVFVNCSGSAIAMPWAVEHLPAIVQAWYPGEQGGRAVGQVLFGEANPSGRLPITFYASTADLPPFEDYSMSNRTYRYFKGQPLFAFGHGLSYTKFDYRELKLAKTTVNAGAPVELTFTLKNAGKADGAEVAQVYFRHVHSAIPQPRLALCGFTRIDLARAQATKVSLSIPTGRFRNWDTVIKQYVIEPGEYELLVGASSDDLPLHATLTLVAP